MELLAKFENLSSVRFYQDDTGTKYANMMDLAKVLMLPKNTNDVLTKVWAEYRFKFAVGVGQPGWFVSEPGIYQMIFTSDHNRAVELQRWVFEEVLPKLRAEGGYITSSATNEQVDALVTNHKKQIAALEKENLAIAKEHDGMLTAIKRDGQLVVYQEIDQYDEDLGDWVNTRRKVPAKATKATRTGTVLFHSIDEAASAGRNKVVLVKMQTERKLEGVKLYPDETGKKCLMKMRPIETVDKHDLFDHLSRKRKVHIVEGVEIPEDVECDINFSPDRGYVGCPTEQYWIIAKKGDYDYDA